jgi:hypothetical protein
MSEIIIDDDFEGRPGHQKRSRKRSKKSVNESKDKKKEEETIVAQQDDAATSLLNFQLQVGIARTETDIISAKEMGDKILCKLIEDQKISTTLAGHYFYLMSIVELRLENYPTARRHCKQASILFQSLSEENLELVERQFKFVNNLNSRLIPSMVKF